MSSQMYVRIRGRVQGPFDEDKMRTLASRGQISRVHQISRDGNTWESAANFPEIFTTSTPQVPTNNTPASHQGSNPPAASEPAPSAPSATETSSGWYYAQDNKEYGPVDFSALQGHIASGAVRHDIQVWREGMPQWLPASEIAGLLPTTAGLPATHSAVGVSVDSGQGSVGEIEPGIIRILKASYNWVMFITIVGYVYSALLLVGGIGLIILGSRAAVFPIVAQGLMTLINAVLCAVGSMLLNTHCKRISKLSNTKTAASLISALDSLRSFWVYAGILLIVFLAFLLFIGVWVMSVGLAFPDF